ncbi:hypothetical protein HHI36_012764, partial [Cryptolaemus montrouzieri]
GEMACVAGRQWGVQEWAEGDDFSNGEQMLPVSAWWLRVCAIASIKASKSDELVARVRGNGHDEAAGDLATRPPWTTRST